MRFNLRRIPKIRLKHPSNTMLLATVYPDLYCPRCGSSEIGLKRLSGGDVIWDCRECSADFKLIFPEQRRF